jgi:type I restriction enzyme M protein
MAIKKSELYSSLWESCNELRGGMDASQYKDYVLTMLFVKYLSDKYAGDPNSLIEVPNGASFEDMVKLKGQPDIGDRINKEILRPLFAANELEGSMEIADFNDDDKLGEGKEKVDRLSKLIAIFETPALNFKDNRAEDDDILGDAYEFLMRHFATESGKSKGQFYTPSEVSRILSKVIDVHKADKPSYTAYDPTCGSGSLLLKVADEAPNGLSLYGQEKDIATKGLAIMNMWLHGYAAEAKIAGKNSISDPQFKEKGKLKRFDFVVANPPFSVKSWSNGIVPMDDEFNRFQGFGVPPDKNGDYAFLLHIIGSLKSTGKGAVILPHGVLFRGNAEAAIRQNIIERKWIKGIIGLPANLFYGTGIPACIIVIDKENTETRKGIFMIDASKGFIKDGNKNRLREQDLHKIVDAFNKQWEITKYSRLVPFKEIEKNEYNLNIPRYIDTQETEDKQDLDAHLNGGVPTRDIDELAEYWEVYPNIRAELFKPLRENYVALSIPKEEIKNHILNHKDFVEYNEKINLIFETFKKDNLDRLNGINVKTAPKKFIHELSEDLLLKYADKPLMNRYKIFQHLMNYWVETMKDDLYILIEDGWKANTKRILEKNKSGKEVDKGWTCDLIPKNLVIQRYLAEEAKKLTDLEAELETTQAEMTSLEEEHSAEEAAFGELDKINKANVKQLIKELNNTQQPAMAAEPDEKYGADEHEPLEIAEQWLAHYEKNSTLKKAIKAQEKKLDQKTLEQFGKLDETDVRQLVIEDKWLAQLQNDIQSEIDAISQRLTSRIKELADRYESKLGTLATETENLETKVATHLEKMGLVWE